MFNFISALILSSVGIFIGFFLFVKVLELSLRYQDRVAQFRWVVFYVISSLVSFLFTKETILTAFFSILYGYIALELQSHSALSTNLNNLFFSSTKNEEWTCSPIVQGWPVFLTDNTIPVELFNFSKF